MAQRLRIGLVFAAVAAATSFLAIFAIDDRSGPAIIIEDAPAEVDVVVWIGGAVATPGIYTLQRGSRLNDVIVAAGGLSRRADTSSFNLAARIEDEDQIEVPFIVSAADTTNPATPSSFGIRLSEAGHPSDSDTAININTASAGAMEALPGIGPALAERIVEYRTEHGPFGEIEELAQVSGISPAMVDEMGDLITVGP